jgi:hypothetical protein
VDRQFTCIGKCGRRVIVGSPPSTADDNCNIGVSFDERRSDRHFIALDRYAFSDDTAIALDRNADH